MSSELAFAFGYVEPPRVLFRYDDRVLLRWETEQPLRAEVMVTDSAGSSRRVVLGDERSTQSVVISGLMPSHPYTFTIISKTTNGLTVSQQTVNTTTSSALVAPRAVPVHAPAVLALHDREALVAWTTALPSIGDITLTAPGEEALTVSSSAYNLAHQALVQGLNPEKTYEASLRIVDAFGVVSTETVTVTTSDASDRDAPRLIAGPYIEDTSATTVTLRWQTDEPTDASLQLLDASNRLVRTVDIATFDREHEITLRDLTPGATYNVRIDARDIARNRRLFQYTYSDFAATFEFRTETNIDSEGPMLTKPMELISCDDGSQRLRFTFDEPTRLAVQLADGLGRGENDTIDFWPFSRVHEVDLTDGLLSWLAITSGSFIVNLAASDAVGNMSFNSASQRHCMTDDTEPPTVQVASGRLTPDTARFVVTCDEAATITAYVEDVSSPRSVASHTVRAFGTNADVALTNLVPGRSYDVWFTAADGESNSTTSPKKRISPPGGQSLKLQRGYNLVSIQGDGGLLFNANELLSHARDQQIGANAVLTQENQLWQAYSWDLGGFPFALEPRQAAFVFAETAGTFFIPSDTLPPTTMTTLPIGWNFMSAPADPSITSADDWAKTLEQQGCSVLMVGRWAGVWKLFKTDIPSSNFSLDPTGQQGYIILVDGPCRVAE